MKQERAEQRQQSQRISLSLSLSARPPRRRQAALEVSVTGIHRPLGTQANVSPLDYSNICLMDVFRALRNTCGADRSLSRWV